MLGMGEAYLPPFAIARGAGSTTLGLLASLPLLVGSLTQILAVRFLSRDARRKTLVAVPAFFQASTWIAIFALPVIFPEHGPLLVLAAAVPYFALGSFGMPPWSSWMGDIVPPARRGDYFGRRDRLRTACQLAALLGAGAVLGLAGRYDAVVVGFAVIFGVAALARVVSAYHLCRMHEPPFDAPGSEHQISFFAFLRSARRRPFARFSIFVACMQCATQLSGPLFSLYMLRDLELSYIEFTTACSVSIAFQALTFHNWGRIADQFGIKTVLALTCLLLPIVPVLWLFSTRFEAVLFYQLVSGVVWAGFNLSATTYVFEAVPAVERPRSVAYHHVIVNTGLLLGALTGGLIAPWLPKSIDIGALHITLFSNLQVLFLLSGLVRLVVALVFLPMFRHAGEGRRPSSFAVLIRVVGLQPVRGLRFSILSAGGGEDERTRTGSGDGNANASGSGDANGGRDGDGDGDGDEDGRGATP